MLNNTNSILTTLLVLLISAVSCSKTTPYVEEVVVETTYLRTWDEDKAVEAIISDNSVSNAVIEVENNRKQDFNWVSFWNKLEVELPKFKSNDFQFLSRLAGLVCKEENTSSYLTFLNKVRIQKRIDTNQFLESVNAHVNSCGEFYSRNVHNQVKEIINQNKEEVDAGIYGEYVKSLFKKTSLIDIYDSNEVINEDIFRKSLNNKIGAGKINEFISLSGIYQQTFPHKELIKELDVSNLKLLDIKPLFKTNQLKSMIHLFQLLRSEVLFETNQSFDEMATALRDTYFSGDMGLIGKRDFSALSEKYGDYFTKATDSLYLLSSLAQTDAQKLTTLKMANDVIKTLVNSFEQSIIQEELNINSRKDYFSLLVKKIFFPELKIEVPEQGDIEKLSFFDQINIQIIKVRSQSKMIDFEKEVSFLCEKFSSINANGNFKKLDDEKAIGCSSVEVNAEYEALKLSFYAVYEKRNSDLKIKAKEISGGIINLSRERDLTDKGKTLDMGKELDGILIPMLFRVRLTEETSDHYMVMPYIYKYQDEGTIRFDYEDYDRPKKGKNAGNLILELDEMSRFMPILVSLGAPGEKGYQAPKKGVDHHFAIDEEQLELNLPFKASLMDRNLRSNRNMKIAFKDVSSKKYYSLTNEVELDLLPNFQRKKLREDLAYINDLEGFSCGASDIECVMKKLYPRAISEINSIFEMELSDIEAHEIFDMTKLAKGLEVKENDLDGERGDNGEIIIQ